MAAKKTQSAKTSSKTGASTKGRPKLHSSHARDARSGPAAKSPRDAARGPRAGRGAAGARPAPTGPRGRPPLAAPKRAGLDTSAPAKRPRARVPMGPAPDGGYASDAARELATAIAIAGLEKKAVGVEILDVAGKVDYADFLVVMTGRSDRQVGALASGIEDALRKKGKRVLSVEGLPHASWVLMDFGDVVVHVFQDEARALYDIEGLWMDAKRLPLPEGEGQDASR